MIIHALKHSFTAVAGAFLLASCAGPPIVPWKREDPAHAAASMENAMDPTLEGLVGKRIRCHGFVHGYTLIISDWEQTLDP